MTETPSSSWKIENALILFDGDFVGRLLDLAENASETELKTGIQLSFVSLTTDLFIQLSFTFPANSHDAMEVLESIYHYRDITGTVSRKLDMNEVKAMGKCVKFQDIDVYKLKKLNPTESV